MPRPEHEPEDYLNKRGRSIFFAIIRHIKEKGILEDIDTLELSMLANSYEVYERMAKYCNDHNFVGEFEGKNGTFRAVLPEYGIMKNEYANVLKHSGKYGLTPGDRNKIFGKLKKQVKKNPEAGLD